MDSPLLLRWVSLLWTVIMLSNHNLLHPIVIICFISLYPFKIHNLQGNILFILLITVFSAPRINSAWHMESPSQQLFE